VEKRVIHARDDGSSSLLYDTEQRRRFSRIPTTFARRLSLGAFLISWAGYGWIAGFEWQHGVCGA
jgi:hypothetical protein